MIALWGSMVTYGGRKTFEIDCCWERTCPNIIYHFFHQLHGKGSDIGQGCGLFFYFSFFKTGIFCVTAPDVLELAFVDQAGLELTEICLPLSPEYWD